MELGKKKKRKKKIPDLPTGFFYRSILRHMVSLDTFKAAIEKWGIRENRNNQNMMKVIKSHFSFGFVVIYILTTKRWTGSVCVWGGGGGCVKIQEQSRRI